jgi:hypothetical protein
VEFAANRHATDDVLERYSMGCVAGPELAGLEEHLLVCDYCQDRLAREDSIRQLVRDGAEQLQRPHPAMHWGFPKWAWGLGLAAVGLLLFAGSQWPSFRRSTVQPAVVLLQTTRGAENPALAAAPAGRPISLVLDLTDLPQFSAYTVEIVDNVGHPAFHSSESPVNNKLQTSIARGLAAGAYFVRLYTPTRELLREYALIVRA